MAICPPTNTIGARINPIYGIRLSASPANIFTVIAIPPVERHSANRRAYDNIVPRNPVTSITPYGPFKYMSIRRLKIITGPPKISAAVIPVVK